MLEVVTEAQNLTKYEKKIIFMLLSYNYQELL